MADLAGGAADAGAGDSNHRSFYVGEQGCRPASGCHEPFDE
jgi:hypothetical protein